jgi:hypothetical protein
MRTRFGKAFCAKSAIRSQEQKAEITTMTSDDSKDEVIVMVLVDMAAICRNLAASAAM